MRLAAAPPAWRPAALRGLGFFDGCNEALLALGGGQYLRIPVDHADAPAFRERLGGCVWVDLHALTVRLELPAVAHGG